MKKMLTLMGFGAFTLAASALSPLPQIDLRDYKLAPGVKLKMEQIQKQNLADIQSGTIREGVIKKTMVQGNNVWDVWVMNNDLRWCDALTRNDGQPIKFEDMPFYYVSLYVLGEDKSKPQEGYNTITNWPLLWPAQCAWDLSLFMEENPDLSKLDQSITDLEDLANDKVNCGTFVYDGRGTVWALNDDKTNVAYWPVGLPSWFGITSFDLEGRQYNIPAADESFNPTTATSTYSFKTYDPSESYLEMDITMQLLDNNNSAIRRIIPYTGGCRVNGFAPVYSGGEFGDIHIVNLGSYDNEKSADDDPFDFEEWGPLEKYYVFAVSPEMKIVDYSAEYNDDKWGLTNSLLYTQADNVTEINDDFLLFGMILNHKSTENPANINAVYEWVLPEERPNPWYDGKPNTPKTTLLWDWNEDGGSVIPFGYNDANYPWSTRNWAMLCQAGGYNTLIEHPSKILIGTTNGFEFVGHDSYKNKYFRNYKGDITYHPNSNKMSETVKIPAVGTLEPSSVESIQATAEAGIFAGNGEIRIVANVDTQAAVYSLSGAVVAQKSLKAGESVVVPVEKGIYVVKAGNGAKKVAL